MHHLNFFKIISLNLDKVTEINLFAFFRIIKKEIVTKNTKFLYLEFF